MALHWGTGVPFHHTFAGTLPGIPFRAVLGHPCAARRPFGRENAAAVLIGRTDPAGDRRQIGLFENGQR